MYTGNCTGSQTSQECKNLVEEFRAAYKKDVANGAKWSNKYSASDSEGQAELAKFKNVANVDLNYHRFWHAGDVMMANGAMALLYPDVTPGTTPAPETTPAPTTTTTAAPVTTPAPETTPAPTTGEIKAKLYGDTNCDDKVDVSDAVLLAKYLTADASGSVSEQGRANANVISGTLDGEDLSAILMLIAKIVDQNECPLTKLPTIG